VLRSELLIPSDIALYLAWKIDHERATDPFQRLMIKYKVFPTFPAHVSECFEHWMMYFVLFAQWLASSPHIDWIQRSEYMLVRSSTILITSFLCH
jgi:hypothetical protein